MRKLIAASATVMALAAGSGESSAQESYDVSGRDVAVYNLAGEVEVIRGSGSNVVVEVVRGGADADRLAVEIGNVNGRPTLRVLYPDDEVLYARLGRGSKMDVRVRRDGTFYGQGVRRGDRVQIRGSGDGLEAHADLRIHVPADGSVAVYLAAGKAMGRDLDADLLFDLGAAPATVVGVVGRVDVDTGSGAVAVTNVRGDVSIDTGSGRVDIDDIEGDDVSVDTGSGHVIGSAIRAPVVSFDTGSGRIQIDALAAREVLCDTGSGSVELRMTTDVDHLEIDTGSGSVALWLPEDAGADVEVDTGSGGIDVNLPIRVRQSSRRYLKGVLGDGVGEITVDTGSGSISIHSN